MLSASKDDTVKKNDDMKNPFEKDFPNVELLTRGLWG